MLAHRVHVAYTFRNMTAATRTTRVRDCDLRGLDRIGELTNRRRPDVISHLVEKELKRLGAAAAGRRNRKDT